MDLTIKSVDNCLPIMDCKDKKIRKQNKQASNRKGQLDNLLALVWALPADFAGFLYFHPISFALLWSCSWSFTYLVLLLGCFGTPIGLFSRLLLALIFRSLAILLPLLVLGLAPPHLTSIALNIFKWALLNELLRRRLTSTIELLCQFPPLGSLLIKIDYKRNFDKEFINSCLLASNNAQKEVDISFAKCSCFTAVKLNWS